MKFVKPILLTVAAAASVLTLWVLNVIYLPLTVTNPDDPRFDPNHFRFEHYSHIYGNETEFNKALLKMFPPGTDRAYVDQILVKQANAEASANELTKYHNADDSDYTYIYGSWLVRFVFNANNKTTMMTTGVVHYGVDPIETFWENARGKK